MSKFRQGAVIVLLAAAVLHITLNGNYTRYVRASLRPYLYVSCGVLLVLGILSIVSRQRKGGAQNDHDHGSRGPRIGWLILAPVFAILLIAPPALGSFGVDLSAGLAQSRGQSVTTPLPPGNPVDLSLTDYAGRTAGKTLAGRTIRLTGFVTPAGGGSWYITRYIIVCCAADAVPVGARVLNASPPDANAWVAVTGTWEPGSDGTPTIVATNVQNMPTPQDPYL